MYAPTSYKDFSDMLHRDTSTRLGMVVQHKGLPVADEATTIVRYEPLLLVGLATPTLESLEILLAEVLSQIFLAMESGNLWYNLDFHICGTISIFIPIQSF